MNRNFKCLVIMGLIKVNFLILKIWVDDVEIDKNIDSLQSLFW